MNINNILKNNEKRFSIYGILLVLAILIVGVSSIAPWSNHDTFTKVDGDDTTLSSITYHSNVCKQITRADGIVEPQECSHNLLYDTGKELIETYLGDTGGSGDEVDQIVLCDADVGCATPVAGASETFNAITDRGLAKTTGTYASLGTGNWTISNVFTATGSVKTNVTRLQNTAGTNFAGNAFTLVSLENQDSLTITWNIWVE